jgi:hypothetical protein
MHFNWVLVHPSLKDVSGRHLNLSDAYAQGYECHNFDGYST